MTSTSARNARLWIAWERQRRSQELARRLGCSIHIFDIKGPARYPKSILGTLSLLLRKRPRQLFVQNPSMVLAVLACVYGLVSGTRVVVDRHTTFLLNKPRTFSIRRSIFLALSRFTLRRADLTIVTNQFLADLVVAAGGRAVVLPDPIPSLVPTSTPAPAGEASALYICSFAADEPIGSVLEAARSLPGLRFYISGDYSTAATDWRRLAPANVTFTGFLPAADFVNLLFAVDAILVLTTSDHTMLCGCYEALAARKPLITSDKPELREYFPHAAFVGDSAESIRSGLQQVFESLDLYRSRTESAVPETERRWAQMFASLERLLA